MKKIVISIITIVIIVLGIFYFSNIYNTAQKNQVQTTTTPANTQTQNLPNTVVNTVTPAKIPSTKTYNISIANFAFNSKTLTINKGDTITWTNNDSVPHQVKGDTLTSLSGPVITNGQSYSYTFNNIGTFAYHCNIHPSMLGSVTVQ
jgi:amicyanin